MTRSRIFPILSTGFILVTLCLGIYLVGIKTGFIKHAAGTPANLVIDLGQTFTNPGNCWDNLAQGGESRDRMLSAVTSQVAALHPKYIRIDHVFDNYDVVSKTGGQINFNWNSLDQTISDIRASGATPFLSLSYMPSAISENGNVDSLPASFGDWQYVVQKTIEHVSGHSGLNLSNVYYEVWNEPDNFGHFSVNDYSNLYYYAQLGAKSAQGVNAFKIGGPGTSGLYESWFDSLLSQAQAGKIRLDFFSWHNYYSDVNKYDQDVQSANSWLASYSNFSGLELIISEMGIDSANNKAYDGSLSAINTLASVAVVQGNVNKCFNFEIVDGVGPTQYWGRWGLLTNSKFGTPVAKPRYYAIQFLNNMAGDRISVTGSGDWVKAFGRESSGKFRILVVNYDPSGSHAESVPFKLINMPFKDFTMKRIDFMGGTTTLSEHSDTNTWSVSLGFFPNTSAIIEITPQ